MRPGVNVTIRDTIPPRSQPTDVDTWFVVGVAERGLPAATLLRSMSDFTRYYGNRWSTDPSLYDAIDTYFREGGQKVYVSRVLGPAAVTAFKVLNDGTAAAAVRVEARGAGSWGNNLTVQVAAGTVGGYIKLQIRESGTLVEESPEVNTKADLLNWTTSRYVVLTSAGAGSLPAVAAAAALATGADDYASIADTHRVTALVQFGLALGPGQVSIPGQTSGTIHSALLSHANLNNRVAILDAPDSASSATLVAAATALIADVNARYGGMFGPRAIVPGITYNTTRDVPYSAVQAGMMARNPRPNEPAAGAQGVSRYAIQAKYDYTDTERQTLNDAGVNIARNILGQVRTYGYRTLVNGTLLPQWLQLNSVRTIMAIKSKANEVGEIHMFKGIDGRGRELSKFNGDLTGVLIPYFEDGALYGDTPEEAFYVDTGSLVNTPTTIAAGQLKATISVRTSPFAETVDIEIVKVPLPTTTAPSPLALV